MKGPYLMEGREQEWEDRVSSSEQKEDFHVDFLEEFIRCF